MRPPTACQLCRSRRRRCDRLQQHGSCTLCKKQNVLCFPVAEASSSQRPQDAPPCGPAPSYRTNKQHPSSSTVSPGTQCHTLSPSGPLPAPEERDRSPSNGSEESSVVRLPPLAVCLHLATLYFDYVHDQLHSIFHRPSFMADVAVEKISPVIMFAMIALSARFSSHEIFAGVDPCDRGKIYVERSVKLFDPRKISLESIQAAVLLGANCIANGDAAAESVYYCIACRMAQLLNLAGKQYATDLEAEVGLRVWYSLCMVDEWSSTGIRGPKQMLQATPPGLRLPMNEMTFLQLRHHSRCPEYQRDPSSSLLTQMVLLNRIFADINNLNQRAAHQEAEIPDQCAVGALLARLDLWESELPPHLRDEAGNLAYFAAQNLGRMFVAVYLGYYHFGQMLCHRFLCATEEESGPEARKLSDRCKFYADRLCSITYSAWDISGCAPLYNMVGHVLVVASTVQIHTLLFSADAGEVQAARARLERNFEILLKLRDYWPTLEVSVRRLRTFHKACLRSAETSFQFDRWMLKFLSEFGNPIEDREEK